LNYIASSLPKGPPASLPPTLAKGRTAFPPLWGAGKKTYWKPKATRFGWGKLLFAFAYAAENP